MIWRKRVWERLLQTVRHAGANSAKVPRNAARQPAEGFHVLCLTKLFLKFDLSGDISEGAFVIEDVAGLVTHNAGIFSDCDDAMIAGAQLELDIGIAAIALQPVAQGEMEVGIDKKVSRTTPGTLSSSWLEKPSMRSSSGFAARIRPSGDV